MRREGPDTQVIDLKGAVRPVAAPRPGAYWRPANSGHVSPPLPTIDPTSLRGKTVPERRWIVPHWVPLLSTTMLTGHGGDGKTLLAMQLATACATGGKWLGLDVVPCKVIAFCCEDDPGELHRRQDAINRHLGIDFGHLKNLLWLSRVGSDNILAAAERPGAPVQPTELFQRVHDLTQNFGAQLLILDSLHDLFAGNENARTDARQFISLLTGLARDMDGATLITAHPSLQGLATGSGLSGSTAWHNAVRSRLYLSRLKDDDGPADRDMRILSRLKANYSSVGDEMRIRWVDGVFVPDAPLTGMAGALQRRNAERVFIELLASTERDNRPVSDSRNASNYAPRLFAIRPDRQGFGRADFERAMEALFATAQIEIVAYGRPGDTRRRIVAKRTSPAGDV
jgi:RecA-family ATPase